MPTLPPMDVPENGVCRQFDTTLITTSLPAVRRRASAQRRHGPHHRVGLFRRPAWPLAAAACDHSVEPDLELTSATVVRPTFTWGGVPMSALEPIERRITRCAIYTRKSTEFGLDAAVNSLDTQRDVCQSYIKCQGHRNWTELPCRYDDGGYSGGTLTRPALTRLLHDVEHGRVDVIVIYKIDRLTRSLLDFVRLTDILERYGV